MKFNQQVLLCLFFTYLKAEIQTFDNYRLPLLTLTNKHRLVINDQDRDVNRQAAVKIDLNLTLAHSINDTYYIATLIEADQATSSALEEEFE